MYSCIIIDDEPIAIKVIKKHLSAFNQFEVVGEFNNAIDAMVALPQIKVDLVFSDIQMPRVNGVEFVKSLSNSPKIIFTTAYRNYAVEAFDLNIVDYLLKPISFERFAKAIHKFIESSATTSIYHEPDKQPHPEENFILLKGDKKHHKIDLKDILYFESLGDYVIAYTITGKIITKERISKILDIVPSKSFIRIHRGFIASIKAIDAIGPGFVELDGKKLPIGRNYKINLDILFLKNS